MSVMAFRDIQPREEVTISCACHQSPWPLDFLLLSSFFSFLANPGCADSQLGLTYEERQETLLRRWGFKCTCHLCSRTPDEIADSDHRRKRLSSIREDIIALVTDMKYDEAVKEYEDVLSLVQEERLVEHLGEHHEVLARLHMALGHRADAEKHARLAVSDMVEFGGPQDDEKVVELRGILKQLSRG